MVIVVVSSFLASASNKDELTEQKLTAKAMRDIQSGSHNRMVHCPHSTGLCTLGAGKDQRKLNFRATSNPASMRVPNIRAAASGLIGQQPKIISAAFSAIM